MPDIAMGVVILSRVDKLRGLLDSAVDKGIDRVYIADNGEKNEEKANLYNEPYPFDIEVLDLTFDIGLGYCRNQIVEALEEDYLLMADNDHQISNNIDILLHILQSSESLGGISGSMIEPERGRHWQSAKDFRLLDDILVKGSSFETKEIEFIDGYPFVEFDFVPYPTLYRSDCLNDYSWDPNIMINFAHGDFYFHHWMNTEWKFGICPEVCFSHYPGGDDDYSDRRFDEVKIRRSEDYFLSKWYLNDFRTEGGYWFDTRYRIRSRPLHQRVVETYNEMGFRRLMAEGIAKGRYHIKKWQR